MAQHVCVGALEGTSAQVVVHKAEAEGVPRLDGATKRAALVGAQPP